MNRGIIALCALLTSAAFAHPAFADCSQLSAKLVDGQPAHAQDVVNFASSCLGPVVYIRGAAANGYTTFRGVADQTYGWELDVFGSQSAANSGTYYVGANGVALMNVNNAPLAFGTANTPRLFIDAIGNVGIGTTSPTAVLDITGNEVIHGAGGISFGGVNNSNSNNQGIWFYDIGNTAWGRISRSTTNGNLLIDAQSGTNVIIGGTNGGNVGIGTAAPTYTLTVNGTAYATGAQGALSDMRDKTDIATLSNAVLDTIMKLRPVTFEWKKPKDDGMKGRQTGLIAQEVEKVLPATVMTANDARKSKSIKYNELTAVLIKAVQEQQKQIAASRAVVEKQARQITALQQENRRLAGRVGKLENLRLAKVQ